MGGAPPAVPDSKCPPLPWTLPSIMSCLAKGRRGRAASVGAVALERFPGSAPAGHRFGDGRTGRLRMTWEMCDRSSGRGSPIQDGAGRHRSRQLPRLRGGAFGAFRFGRAGWFAWSISRLRLPIASRACVPPWVVTPSEITAPSRGRSQTTSDTSGQMF